MLLFMLLYNVSNFSFSLVDRCPHFYYWHWKVYINITIITMHAFSVVVSITFTTKKMVC